MSMTPDQIESLIEATAERTAAKMRDEMRGMLGALGFNMDPDKLHEEQQFIAFARSIHTGARRSILALLTGGMTAFAGLIVGAMWYLLGNRPHP